MCYAKAAFARSILKNFGAKWKLPGIKD
jgi:hypothetical protein